MCWGHLSCWLWCCPTNVLSGFILLPCREACSGWSSASWWFGMLWAVWPNRVDSAPSAPGLERVVWAQMSSCCWEMSDLFGNGHSGSGFPKGRKCPPDLAGVTGSRQCPAMLCKNLAGDGGSCCFPAEHIPKSLLLQVGNCSFGPLHLQPLLLLFQAVMLKTPGFIPMQ